MQTNDHSAATMAALAALGVFWFLAIAVAVGFGIIINWRIASKAGYSGVYSLLMLVPVVNVIVLIVFAFSRWPIEEALANARGMRPGGLVTPP